MNWDVGIPGKEGVSLAMSAQASEPAVPDTGIPVTSQTIWSEGVYKLQMIFPEGELLYWS